ncbi:MAG: hypothetical protein IKM07_04460 [Clostridia bacterium]|nr:hypothetical protein [Clostridia bacterium]
MKEINTFRGSMPLSKYNRILAHEHLLLDMSHEAVLPETEEDREVFFGDITMERLGLLRRNPYVVRTNLILDDPDDAIRELTYLEKHNVGLYIDLTSIGLGRDMEKLSYISRHTDIDIVVGTGYFVHDVLDNADCPKTAGEMAAVMLSEIEDGIEGTGIRAGVIGEIGVSEKIYPIERESLLAAAMVHQKTGLPVYLHTYPWSRAGLEAAELLVDQGVDPASVCVCHIDVTMDHAYITEILSKGFWVEFDNFGKEFFFEAQDGAFAGGPFDTDVERVRMLRRLTDEGWGSRLLIANDLCLKASLHKYGGWGYDHIFENIIPMMRTLNFSADEIRLIVDENPLHFLTGIN